MFLKILENKQLWLQSSGPESTAFYFHCSVTAIKDHLSTLTSYTFFVDPPVSLLFEALFPRFARLCGCHQSKPQFICLPFSEPGITKYRYTYFNGDSLQLGVGRRFCCSESVLILWKYFVVCSTQRQKLRNQDPRRQAVFVWTRLTCTRGMFSLWYRLPALH